MLQMDMTAWVKPGTKPTIGVIRDFVSPELSEFLVLLVDEYSTIGHTDTECGYVSSRNRFRARYLSLTLRCL